MSRGSLGSRRLHTHVGRKELRMWSNSYVPLWGREVFFPIPTRICDANDKSECYLGTSLESHHVY